MKKIITTLLLIISCTISPVFAAPQESIENEKINAFEQAAIEKLTQIALNEEGYLEKISQNYLYEKIGDAGASNYTKFAYDLYVFNFYEYNLNGLPWCDMFVDWCFVQAFGAEDAKYITYQLPYGSAACSSSLNFYQSANQFYQTPKVGDQIFFDNHTGLVYKIDETTVYTIEGNTSSYNGITIIEEAVCYRSYPINSSRIIGYGRPNYRIIANKEYENEKLRIKEEVIQTIQNNCFFIENKITE